MLEAIGRTLVAKVVQFQSDKLPFALGVLAIQMLSKLQP